MANEVFTNVSAEGAKSGTFRVSNGYPSVMIFEGGFDGGTVTMEIETPNGNWVPDPNGISVTAEGLVQYDTSFVPSPTNRESSYNARLSLDGTAGGAADLTVNVE